MNRIKNLDVDWQRKPDFSVKAVNKAIQNYAMGKGPAVDAITAQGMKRPYGVRIRNGVAEAKLQCGEWVSIHGVMTYGGC